MIQLIIRDLRTKREEVKIFTSKDKCEEFLESKCCPIYDAHPEKSLKYRVAGATYDTKSEYAILKPYLFDKKDDREEL